jgi:hypothetical protein
LWEQPEHAEQQAADESAGEAHSQIPEKPEPLAVPGDDQPGKTSSEQTDDDPNDELTE